MSRAGRRLGTVLGVSGLVLAVSLAALWGLRPEPEPPPDLDAARRAAGRGQWAAVEARLGRWVDAHPDDGDSAVLLGMARLNTGKPDAAAAAFAGIPETHPAWGQAQALIAEVAIQKHDLPEAEKRLRLAVAKDPDAVPPRQRLIYVLSLQQRNGEAREQLRDWFRKTRDPKVLLDLVRRLRAREDDVRGLVPEIEACLAVSPDDPFLRRARGLALLYQGDLAGALPHLQAAASALENDPVGRFALVECELGLGRTDVTVDALGPRPADPAGAARWNLLRGRLADALGRPDNALAALRAAAAAAPDDREAHFRLGQLLARRGDAAGAKTHLDRAAEIDARQAALQAAAEQVQSDGLPADPELYERLGRLCLDVGFRDEARAWADLALTIDPTRAAFRQEAESAAGPTLALLAFPKRKARAGRPAEVATTKSSASRWFEDVTAASGVDYRYDSGASESLFLADTIGGGVAAFDYDGDGLLDLYFVNGCALPVDPSKPPAPNRLFRNLGGFRFEDVTAKAGVGGVGYGMGCAAGDYDLDGDLDLLVTGVTATLLYRNNGNGTFTDVSKAAGIHSDRWTTAAAFADLDADGDLDAVVAGYVAEDFSAPRDCRDGAGRRIHCSPRQYPAVPDHLFRNNGDGSFTDVAATAGFVVPDGRGLGLAVADFDGDGKLDVYVANDATDDFLFRNLGGLRFEEVAHAAGVATDGEGRATASMGTVADDLNGDGLLDLVHTNLLNESTTLHRNVGGGLFRDASVEAGLRAPSRGRTGFGVAAFDADLDGRLDLFVANGHVDDQPWLNSPMAQTPQFFQGGEVGRFRVLDAGAAAYLNRRVVGRGLAAADLDNDGRVDLVVVHRDAPAVLLKNFTTVTRWVGIDLDDQAVGARVTCDVAGRKQIRWRTSGTGYLGSADRRLVFALGESAAMPRLEVQWPSGHSETWDGLPAGKYHPLRAGSAPKGR